MTSSHGRRLLAVETATAWQSVALLEDEEVLGIAEQDARGSHARSLMVAIDCLLRETGMRLHDLQGLAVSIGPGSFTGLRVGLATMLGFRAVLEIPVIPVPTLEAMAWNVRHVKGLLVPVLKSRHNEVYWAQYEWLPGPILHRRMAEQVGPPISLARAFGTSESGTLFGDGCQTYGIEIRNTLEAGGATIQDVAPELHRPSAVTVALAARHRLECGWLPESALVPLYVQRTEAEAQLDAQEGMPALDRRRQRVAQRMVEARQRVIRKDRGPRSSK